MSGQGRKHDQGKLRWATLLHWPWLQEIVQVLEHGAVKYEINNWQRVPDAEPRYRDALTRHWTAYLMGERVDPDSGFSHLSHMACCLMFLWWFDQKGGEDVE